MTGSTEPQRALKILVVDDEPDILELFELALAPHGHEVTLADDGCYAVEIASKQPFDVAFIDIAMRPMDGLSTLSRLKAVSPDTRYVMMTAFYDGQLSRRVRNDFVADTTRLGARGCLRKPFDLDTIVQTAEYFGRQSADVAGGC